VTLWLATSNVHKKQEIAAILPGHTIKTPDDAGIVFDPHETGATFLENALVKAQTLYQLVQEPVLSDDSGLCVDALGGRPGIYSARYGSEDGKKLDSRERNALLLHELGDNPCRTARFVCALVLVIKSDRLFAVQETLEGLLIREERGSGGFGYDPILYLPDSGCTVAELAQDDKNRLSHRGKAVRALTAFLNNISI
jgi:XTP/dITP diphosphohydrolase